MRSEVLETIGPDGWGLRVEFLWHVDRFRHVISAIEPTGVSIPLLESLEGSLADNWPPSPPLQSLHLETQPGGRRVALLVGMAGKSHWSASIGLAASGTGLVFDLACRASGSPGQIGTSYRIASAARLADADAEVMRLQFGDYVATVAGSADRATPTGLRLMDGAEFTIQPQGCGTAVQPTRRWLYSIHMAHAGLCTEYFVRSTE
jgi:hypothetical protein